ncbi:MAG TPA: type I restriction-modification system subunit M N-terminal domain-containing protein [Anaerolineales bacterium]|nr:type I restriction-modification system subunit M N-terminal domain-containing protein [Anaerolineales bacterium]
MPANNTTVEKRLWESADELRANSKLKSSEYSIPVLGLIFLRYADFKFAQAESELVGRDSVQPGLSQTRLPPAAPASRRRALSRSSFPRSILPDRSSSSSR